MHIRAIVCTYTCVYGCVCVHVCVCEAANHRLIEAIRELAEQHHIATPDGQTHSIYTLRTFKTHTCAPITYIKQTLCSPTHGARNIDRLTGGILIHTAHDACINRLRSVCKQFDYTDVHLHTAGMRSWHTLRGPVMLPDE